MDRRTKVPTGRVAELYQEVTDEVVRQIEAGAPTWRMPWQAIADTSAPVNATTHAAYRGGNHLHFSMVAAARGWAGHWATYKQWQSIGAQVRRGEKSTVGIKWSIVASKADTGDDAPAIVNAEGRRMVPFAFSVFAAEQVDGWEAPTVEPRDTPERIDEAERFFAGVGARVGHGGNRAFFSPSEDRIQLPKLDQFGKVTDYYATSAHEHGHWTGHGTRLARDLSGRFGTDGYAAEELVAELSSAFTCRHLGISMVPRPDHASYLDHWLRILKADARALFAVASKAQAATDYLVTAAGAHPAAQAA